MYNENRMNLENITLCPERTEYKKFINDPESKKNLKPEEFNAIRKALQEKYKLAFHNYVAEIFPYLRFETGEEKVYWNYNIITGVYDEVAMTTAKEWVIKLLIDENLLSSATEAFAKTVLSRYRACYAERGSCYDDFDNDDNYFHASNGWVQLDTLAFTSHTPERLSRRKSAVKYDAKAVCPHYDTFLDTDIRVAADAVRVMDQFSGLLLTPDIHYEKMLTLIGRAGSGKSTLLNIWKYVLGGMATQKKLSGLSGDKSRFLGSSLIGKTLCWFDEVDAKRAEMDNSLGTLITGETIDVERKSIDTRVEARNKIKCVLTANSLPLSLEIGMFRRLILINFTRSFYDEGITDNELKYTLQAEASGILNRMLKGLKDLRDMRGFTLIAGHEDLVEDYKNASDAISGFLSTYFEPAVGEEVLASELFEAYKTYRVGDNFTKSLTPQKFGMMMRVQPLTAFSKITSKKYTNGNRWVGLRLKNEYKFNQFGILELVNF